MFMLTDINILVKKRGIDAALIRSHLTLALEWAADLPYPAEADEITHRVEVLRTRRSGAPCVALVRALGSLYPALRGPSLVKT